MAWFVIINVYISQNTLNMSEYIMLLKWRFRAYVGALSNTSLKISLPIVPL